MSSRANIKSKLGDPAKYKVHDIDTRCSPSQKHEIGSCIALEVLCEMAKAYNKSFPQNAIDVDDSVAIEEPVRYKKYLLNELDNRLKQKCKTQQCWSKQRFIQNMKNVAREELAKYTWRPEGPDTGNEWLNTDHIDKAMAQYEKRYKDFKFLGVMPRDFQDHDVYRITHNDYLDLLQAKKIRLGIIYNTDPVGKPGEHWNALFANLKTGEIYFFDSFGVAPNSEVRAHMKQIKEFIQNNCDQIVNMERNHNNLMTPNNDTLDSQCKKLKVAHNDKQHQYEGSECGVYSINFITRMLRGDTFKQIVESRISDSRINKCRKAYFSAGNDVE